MADRGQRMRAPSRDGAIVAVPPLREAGALLTSNRQRLHAHAAKRELFGRPWSDLRRQARHSAVAAALEYLQQPADAGRSPETLLVAGHQPELFHPGVWVKNFALYGLARAHGATPLNLVIDNDTVKSTALRLPVPPAGREDRPHLRSVRFDRWTGETPYEERSIADRELFADFAARAGELLRGWHYQPMLPDFWSEVLRQAERTSNLGECFAAARRTFERAWGCHNLEVPLSRVCDTEPFAWFACDLLAHLPHFHALYNEIVAGYRRRNGIRSRNHPVPDLAVEGDWLEAPLWGWQAGSARRGRLFARLHADRLELRVGDDHWPALPAPNEERAEVAVQAWRDLHAHGYKVRSRALITTLYARLFLGHLFIHGIGGGKYDELTDELMQRFYQCEPPEYIVLSATRWLPLPRPAATEGDCRRLSRELRDVHYNPQRHLEETEASEHLAELARRKQEWIARQPATRPERRERFRMLRALTDELRSPLRPREEQLRQQLSLCQRQLRANAVLQRRDYAFCLFPADVLRPFCSQFLTAFQSTGNMLDPDDAE
jgi:hypothetical protein